MKFASDYVGVQVSNLRIMKHECKQSSFELVLLTEFQIT
jgi:hypothetical protein